MITVKKRRKKELDSKKELKMSKLNLSSTEIVTATKTDQQISSITSKSNRSRIQQPNLPTDQLAKAKVNVSDEKQEASILSKKKEKRKLFKKQFKKKLIKEGKFEWKKKKKKIPEKINPLSTPVLTKHPPEVSTNWKALQALLSAENGPSKKKKPKKLTQVDNKSKPRAQKHESPSIKGEKEDAPKERKAEIWFELDDETLIERSESEDEMQEPKKIGKAGASQANTLEQETSRDVPKSMTHILGIDCEMVGVGDDGQDSILARISIINQHGHPIYDKYVRPTEPVTDYRTAFSGIRPHNLGSDALPFKQVQAEVAEMLKGRILVGHSLVNDLQVLFLSHPHRRIRDTQKYKLFKTLCGGMPSLKKLASHILNVNVQTGEHSSVEDAQTAMRLYMMHRTEWEKEIKNKKSFKKKKK